MTTRFTNFGRIASMLVMGTGVLIAQGVQTGDLAGVVTGKGGQPLAGALVRLDTGRGTISTTTNAVGQYRFAHMLVGNAKLMVTANGYIGSSAQTYIPLGITREVNFALKDTKEAGAVVEVVALGTAAETTEIVDGKNTTLDFVNDLPINTRTIQNIALLSPGTTTDANGLVIRGGQATQSQFLVDGVDVMDPVTGGASIFMNEDMIQEIQVVSGGASADMGRFTGGMVNTVTKSGTNAFEGVIRWEMSDPAWNAYNPKDRGAAGTNTFKQQHNTTQNYRFSGPIIKDHLFFVVGYRAISPNQATAAQTTLSPEFGGGQQYYATLADQRKDIKFDWVINSDHRVSYQYNQTNRKRTGIDYANSFFGGSSSPATLSAQNDTFSYTSMAYVGTLASNLVANFHYGYKKEQLGGPGSGGQGGPGVLSMYDAVDGGLYDNGVFSTDPDVRPIENATLSLTYFANSAFGEHELKAGYDWFKSSHVASNGQSPTGVFVYFNGFNNVDIYGNPTSTDISNRVFTPDDQVNTVWDEWRPFTGSKTSNIITSYYINDKWKLNKNFNFNLGLRFDKFTSKNDLGLSNYTVSATTPRLSAIFDPKGDGAWAVEVSYDEYAGQVIQGASDNSSVVGNPAEYDFTFLPGPDPITGLARDPTQRSNWSSTPFYVYDPNAYRHSNLIDPNLKMPLMKETAITVRHADGKGGSYSATLSRRRWSNFVDDFKYPQANPIDNLDLVTTEIKNDPSLIRNYWGLELQAQKQITPAFSIGGNMTISQLKGNYEGSQVGTNGPVNNYGPEGSFVGQPTHDQLGPYGFLAADHTVILQAWSNYTQAIGKGKFNIGVFGNFSTGAPYSNTATQNITQTGVPSAYGTSYTRYFTDRGALRLPDQYNMSLQAAYEYPVYQKMVAFARVNIGNVLNHQEAISFGTTGTALWKDPVTGIWQTDKQNRPGNQFLPSTTYGKSTVASQYLTARTINFACGLRF